MWDKIKDVYKYVVNFEGIDVILSRELLDLTFSISLIACIIGLYLVMAGDRERGTKVTSISFLTYLIVKSVVDISV